MNNSPKLVGIIVMLIWYSATVYAQVTSADSLRWDRSRAYFGAHFAFISGGSEAGAGGGISLRVPVWRFWSEAELFLRGSYAYGTFSAPDIGVGMYPFRWLFGGVAYAAYTPVSAGGSGRTTGWYDPQSAAMLFAGAQYKWIVVEMDIYLWTELRYGNSPSFMLTEGQPARQGFKESNAMGFRLGVIF